MEDLLGIECTSNPDGSITLHQSKYIDSMISRFFTADERQKFKKTSTPYTTNLAQLVIEALEGSTASEPAFPDLVKEYQRMVGSLMYCCTATRPDLAYAVHQHCRALSRPTPELVAELMPRLGAPADGRCAAAGALARVVTRGYPPRYASSRPYHDHRRLL